MRYLLAVLIAVSCFAQDAQVVELSKSDAEHAKSAYAALQKAQAEWDAIKDATEQKYLKVKDDEYAATVRGYLNSGKTVRLKWATFVFSENFKFIVPKVPEQRGATSWLNGCITNTSDAVGQIQYNNTGLTGSANFTFDSTGQTVKEKP